MGPASLVPTFPWRGSKPVWPPAGTEAHAGGSPELGVLGCVTGRSPPFEAGGEEGAGASALCGRRRPRSHTDELPLRTSLRAPLCHTLVPDPWPGHTRGRSPVWGLQGGASPPLRPPLAGRARTQASFDGEGDRNRQTGHRTGQSGAIRLAGERPRGQAGCAVRRVQTKAEKPVLWLRVPQKPPDDMRALPSLPLPKPGAHHPPPL